jgi:hypothetical protein
MKKVTRESRKQIVRKKIRKENRRRKQNYIKKKITRDNSTANEVCYIHIAEVRCLAYPPGDMTALFCTVPLFYKLHNKFRAKFITTAFLLHALSVQQNSTAILILNLRSMTSSSSIAVMFLNDDLKMFQVYV